MSEDNKKALNDAWLQAFANNGVHVPIDRVVVCDSCNDDWTDNPESGGLLFSSYAVCPRCEARWRADIQKYGEEAHIIGSCPKDQSFADWVRQMRGPDAGIRVTVGNL